MDRRVQEPLEPRHRKVLGTITMMNVEINDGGARGPPTSKPPPRRPIVVSRHRKTRSRPHLHRSPRASRGAPAGARAQRRASRASRRGPAASAAPAARVAATTCPGRPASRLRPRRRRSPRARVRSIGDRRPRARCSRPRRGSAPNERAAGFAARGREVAAPGVVLERCRDGRASAAGDSWCSGVAVARRHVPRAVVVAIDHEAGVASLAFRRRCSMADAQAAPYAVCSFACTTLNRIDGRFRTSPSHSSF